MLPGKLLFQVVIHLGEYDAFHHTYMLRIQVLHKTLSPFCLVTGISLSCKHSQKVLHINYFLYPPSCRPARARKFPSFALFVLNLPLHHRRKKIGNRLFLYLDRLLAPQLDIVYPNHLVILLLGTWVKVSFPLFPTNHLPQI